MMNLVNKKRERDSCAILVAVTDLWPNKNTCQNPEFACLASIERAVFSFFPQTTSADGVLNSFKEKGYVPS